MSAQRSPGYSPYVRILIIGSGILTYLLSACASPPISHRNPIDMSHAFDEHTIYWPTNQPFHWEKTNWGVTPKGYWYTSAVFSASEHGGTHLDAPIHFSEDGWTVDQIPPSHLMGEGIVMDIRTKTLVQPDYILEIEDIVQWESRHGLIPANSIVFLLTGWGEFWPDPVRYLGSHTPTDPQTLHFPAFSKASAEFLITHRNIRGLGVDTASIDAGQSRDFPVHQILAGKNRLALENVANLEHLPPRGTWVIALPMKIRGGTGGPARIIGLLP
jgi:kynurenine formamidase